MGVKNKIADIGLRYLIILVISLSYPVINLLLIKPTLYSSYFIINLIYSASILGNSILFNSVQIELIPACIAALAYLLLIVLNLASEMPLNTRIRALLFTLSAFFAFNVMRIFILAIMFSSNSIFFDYAHELFWYFGSIIAVFLIWMSSLKLFKIKTTPFLSDIQFILRNRKN